MEVVTPIQAMKSCITGVMMKSRKQSSATGGSSEGKSGMVESQGILLT